MLERKIPKNLKFQISNYFGSTICNLANVTTHLQPKVLKMFEYNL